jgi:5'-nucleotidase
VELAIIHICSVAERGNMSRRLRIAVDMDEVLADALGKQLRTYNDHFGAHVTPGALHGVELADIVPQEHQKWVLGMLHQPGFFADLEWIPGAQEEMERLCAVHDVFIASAATEFPTSFVDKLNWLNRHLPQVPRHRVVFCGEKSVLNVNYLIDDTPQHFVGLNGVGLLFDAPHNRGDKTHYRVHGWREVPAAIALHEGKRR